MNYYIKVIRREPNPNFAEEVKKMEEHNRYLGIIQDRSYPSEILETNVLLCELTEEQFKAIKAEVFKTFE